MKRVVGFLAIGLMVLAVACEKLPDDKPTPTPTPPTPTPVAVSSVSLNQSSVDLKVGESVTLTATVQPSNATDKTVKWSSSDPAKATVDGNGLISAVSPGTCVISAASGSITASCNVTIVIAGGNEDYGYENLKK